MSEVSSNWIFEEIEIDESDINDEPRWILLDGINALRLIHGVLEKWYQSQLLLKAAVILYWKSLQHAIKKMNMSSSHNEFWRHAY